MASSEEYIELLKGGEASVRKAFDDFYDQFYPLVRSTVLSKGGDEELALDIFQETMLEILAKVNEFNEGDKKVFDKIRSLLGWVLGTARNKVLTVLLRERKLSSVDEIEEFSVNEESEKLIINKEVVELLAEFVENLGEPCRSIIKDKYWGGIANDILAAFYAKKKNAQYAQLHGCKKKLFKIMQKEPRKMARIHDAFWNSDLELGLIKYSRFIDLFYRYGKGKVSSWEKEKVENLMQSDPPVEFLVKMLKS